MDWNSRKNKRLHFADRGFSRKNNCLHFANRGILLLEASRLTFEVLIFEGRRKKKEEGIRKKEGGRRN